MKKKNGEVLGLTRNNHKYKNVPDDLKWAIPLIEIQMDPAFIAAEKKEMQRIIEKLKKEKAAEQRQPFKLLSNFREDQ